MNESAKYGSSDYEIVTPEQATYLRANCVFERQRKISPRQVDLLVRAIALGEFRPVSPVIICVLPGGRKVLVNGNHTLEAVKLYNHNTRLLVTHINVKSMEDVAEIYAVIDAQKRRSYEDIYKAIGLENQLPNAKQVVAAVAIINCNFLQDRAFATIDHLTRMERIDLALQYKKPATLLDNIIKEKTKANVRIFMRRSFLSVILETLKFQPDFATIFWNETLADDGLKRGHPGKALLEYGRNSVSHISQIKPHVFWAARAWNAAYEGRELKVLRAAYNFWLAGTPWSSNSNKGNDPDFVEEPKPLQI